MADESFADRLLFGFVLAWLAAAFVTCVTALVWPEPVPKEPPPCVDTLQTSCRDVP